MPIDNRVTIVIAVTSLIAGIVALVSLAFLIVGQSEEEDRRRHPRG